MVFMLFDSSVGHVPRKIILKFLLGTKFLFLEIQPSHKD